MEKEIKGKLIFSHVDPYMARFKMEQQEDLISKAELVIKPDAFPADFELAEYNVTGAYMFKIKIESKKKK